MRLTPGEGGVGKHKPLDAEIREHFHQRLDRGVASDADAIQEAVEVFSQGTVAPNLSRLVAQQFEIVSAQRRALEFSWTEDTDCDRLDAAFKDLNARGIVARQDFTCCGNCGLAEIENVISEVKQAGKEVRGYSFFHAQDTDSAVEGMGLYLYYGDDAGTVDGALAIGREICEVLDGAGLKTVWDGELRNRIHVQLDWRKRHFPRNRS